MVELGQGYIVRKTAAMMTVRTEVVVKNEGFKVWFFWGLGVFWIFVSALVLPLPFSVFGLEKTQVSFPFVANDFATGEASNGDNHPE